MLVLSHFHSVIKDSGPERRTYVILSKVGDKKETVRQQQSRNAHADQHRTSHANVISQGFLLTYSQQDQQAKYSGCWCTERFIIKVLGISLKKHVL